MGCKARRDISNLQQTPESTVKRNCLKIFFCQKCVFSSEHWFFLQLTAATGAFLLTVVCFSQFFEPKRPSYLVQCVQHFRRGRWQCAKSYIKSGYSYLLCMREGEKHWFLWSLCAVLSVMTVRWKCVLLELPVSSEGRRREGGDCNLLAPRL